MKYVTGKKKAWIKWLHLGEFCYNTTFHMSIGMYPLQEIYGYDASNLIEHVCGHSRAPMSKDWTEESQEILKALKDNLQFSQNQQKKYANQHRVERHFQVNELVYLRLQPYKQTTIRVKVQKNSKQVFMVPKK